MKNDQLTQVIGGSAVGFGVLGPSIYTRIGEGFWRQPASVSSSTSCVWLVQAISGWASAWFWRERISANDCSPSPSLYRALRTEAVARDWQRSTAVAELSWHSL